ncbi:MAG: phenylacetate--CoA ligase family protein [Phycisphaerales bacterium]|nr:MAG: phenylacetate--CoA ligase family protein [Phycisphaerales bacterium]
MNRHLGRFLLAALSPRMIQRWGGVQAVRTFRRAAATVPAYRDFLTRLRVPINSIWTYDDFARRVPVCDKENYLRQYPLEMLCRHGTLSGKYTLERSSGYSGTPFFWLRARNEDRKLRDHVEYMFRDMFQAHRTQTLVVVTWSQGTWVTGEKFARTVRHLGESGRLKVTVVSPGINLDETIEILTHFLPRFEQTVMAGYPPFLRDIIVQGRERGIDWPRHRVHLFTGGEGFPENWRDFMAEALAIERINRHGAGQIIAGYGSADTGIGAGGETPLALLVRRLAWRDQDLCRDLFGGKPSVPSVFQYEPTLLFAEQIDGELVFTCRSAMPLVRYNIHDRGGTITLEHLTRVLRDHGYNHTTMLRDLGWPKETHYPLPLFYVFGRSDGTATIYGVNIYTEDIYQALSQRDVVSLHTGEFRVRTEYTGRATQRLTVQVRLRPETSPSPALSSAISRQILNSLCDSNTEYRHLHDMKGTRVEPAIELTHAPLGDGGNGFKHRYH